MCGYFSISIKRPSIEGPFLVWFNKIMFLVRTYSTQKMLNEYLTSLNGSFYKIEWNGDQSEKKLNMHKSINLKVELLFL